MDLPNDDRGHVDASTEIRCEQELEQRHREGYAKKPAKKGEFDDWEREQVWGN